MKRPEIEKGRIDLWYCYIDRANSAPLLQEYRNLLNAEERARADRLRLDRVLHEYLVTRAMVRCVLSHYGDVQPERWRFAHGRYGKPVVAAPWDGYESFNLSHSDGLVVCAVAAEGQLGVDVESLDRKTTGLELAERFFSPAEVATLHATPAARQPEVFIQIWTLKEAYIKAIGHGLSIPLNSFFLKFHSNRAAELHMSNEPLRRVADWRFGQVRMGRHHVSLAVSEPNVRDMTLAAREIVPLAETPRPATLAYDTENNWFALKP